MTKIYGLLGYPIKRSLSPLIHNFLFKKYSIDSKYILFEREHFSISDLEDLKKIPIYGISITMPYKSLIYSFFQDIHQNYFDFLKLCNTLKLENGKYIPYNTDTYGAMKVLSDIKDLKLKKIILLGSGSVARIYLFILFTYFEMDNIILMTRNMESAKEIQKDIKLKYEKKSLRIVLLDSIEKTKRYLKKSNLMINTTPIGMRLEDQIPFDINYLHSNFIILDSIYYPGSILKKIAKEKKILYVSGLKMLIYQAMKQFDIWQGFYISDKDEIYEEIYNEIAAQGIEPQ